MAVAAYTKYVDGSTYCVRHFGRVNIKPADGSPKPPKSAAVN